MAKRILIIGVYLPGQPNYAVETIDALGMASNWQVEQRWAALGEGVIPEPIADRTAMVISQRTPKFALLNRLLTEVRLSDYDYLMVCDDDVLLPDGFLDHYLGLVERHGFALAQPARTANSYSDHPFVEQLPGLKARRTRFVEIGPVFSIRHDLFDRLLPFDTRSPMGWGLDFAWPCIVEGAGLAQGIIDATPVDHSLRKPVHNYDWGTSDGQMHDFLLSVPHLAHSQAFRILESYV